MDRIDQISGTVSGVSDADQPTGFATVEFRVPRFVVLQARLGEQWVLRRIPAEREHIPAVPDESLPHFPESDFQ